MMQGKGGAETKRMQTGNKFLKLTIIKTGEINMKHLNEQTKCIKFFPRRKLLHQEYVCEVTEKLTEILYGASNLYRAYVCGTYTDKTMAIRVPGCTVGRIELNGDDIITEVTIYDYALNRFEGDPNETLKQFVGTKVSYEEDLSNIN